MIRKNVCVISLEKKIFFNEKFTPKLSPYFYISSYLFYVPFTRKYILEMNAEAENFFYQFGLCTVSNDLSERQFVIVEHFLKKI
jgi:hypothetical protein